MTISRTTLRVDFFDDIYSVINSNVADPQSRGVQWIFSSFPDVKTVNKIGYPILVIKKAKIKKTFPVFKKGRPEPRTPLLIEVYSTSNIVVDQLADAIDLFMNDTYLPQFTFVDYDEDDLNVAKGGENVHMRQMIHTVEIDDIDN